MAPALQLPTVQLDSGRSVSVHSTVDDGSCFPAPEQLKMSAVHVDQIVSSEEDWQVRPGA